ncbi:MAG: bactofilin family protein [Flavobacteriaceae bacterium]
MKNNEINGQYSRIEKTTTIKGEIQSDADIRIDGVLEGSVKTKGKVVIGKDGRVEGQVECANADIEGSLKGNLLVVDTLALKSTSNIEGELIIGKLVVDAGAIFNATVSMRGAAGDKIKPLGKFGKSQEKTA